MNEKDKTTNSNTEKDIVGGIDERDVIDVEMINDTDSDNNFEKEDVVDEIDVKSIEMDELRKTIEKLEKENSELSEQNEKLLRNIAKVENEKKIILKEADRKVDMANEKILKDFIKVIDAINGALKIQVEDKCKECVKGYVDGIKMIDEMFHNVLSDYGIKKIETEMFDPNLHQAVQIVNDENKEDNEIVDVLQEGYKLNENVIRPSMVVVNKKS